MAEINVSNDSVVSVSGDQIVIMRLRQRMTKPEALRLAAWIVAIADDDESFPALLEAVQNALEPRERPAPLSHCLG